MYSLSQYGNMYTNQPRFNAYAAALRAAVNPNSVVLDIGAGTGIFSLLACQFGARQVYAVEPEDSINLARQAAAANGFSDRMICIQNLSTRIDLSDRANVVISDMSGVLPFFNQNIPAIIDARDRLLAPDGSLIAQCDHLRAAVVEAPTLFDKLTKPWSENLFGSGLNLSSGWRLVANTWHPLGDKEVKFLASPLDLAVLDYRSIAGIELDCVVNWSVDSSGMGHGVAVWFDRTVAEGMKLSNEPGAPDAINVSDVYGRAFFPWLEPVRLNVGDTISFRIQADLVGDEYVWRWETRIRSGQEIRANFHQSSLNGHPLSCSSLKRREAEYIPAPNEDSRIDALILSRIDGCMSLRQIAYDLAAKFPSRFNSWEDALLRVGDVTSQYAQRNDFKIPAIPK